jgi:hypothetical protein
MPESVMSFIGNTVSNVPGSAWRMGEGIVNGVSDMISDPVGTATGTAAAVGGVFAPGADVPVLGKLPYTVDAVMQGVADRYGSVPRALNTIRTDPVGFLADASIVTGGAGLAANAARTGARAVGATSVAEGAGRAAQALDRTSQWVDPITGTARVVGSAGRAGERLLTSRIAANTGVGEAPLRAAAAAGFAGGQVSKALRSAMRGEADPRAALQLAQHALGVMMANKATQYMDDKAKWAASNQVIDPAPIWREWQAYVDSLTAPNGKLKIADDAELQRISKLESVLLEWLSNTDTLTPEVLDGLKQTIDTIYPDSLGTQRQLERGVSTMREAVRELIIAEVPEYAAAMEAYAQASRLENEIQQTLSLKGNATPDTTIRKLLSTMRDNVNTNFGQRRRLVDVLDEIVGGQLAARLAGHALDADAPRGISALNTIANSAGVGGFSGVLLSDPVVGAAAGAAQYATSKPRLMGSAYLRAGELARLLAPFARPARAVRWAAGSGALGIYYGQQFPAAAAAALAQQEDDPAVRRANSPQ